MPFWKKEDPWDVDPAKRRRQSEARLAEEEGQSPAGALKDKLLDAVTGEEGGGESLKDAASKMKGKLLSALSLDDGEKKKAEEPEPEPMICPWCGKPMVRRYLWGTQGVWLGEKKPGPFSSSLSAYNRQILDEGNLLVCRYKTMWYCDNCKKIAAELPLEPEYNSITYQPPAEPEAGSEEEGDKP